MKRLKVPKILRGKMPKLIPRPPQRDYVGFINRFLERLETPGDLRFDEPGVAFYIANLRQILEQRGLKKEFDVLMLYSNWLLHSVLSHEKTTGPLLERVCGGVIDHVNGTANASDEISRAIGFDVLRTQIAALSERLGLKNTIVSNNQKWREAVGQICVQLVHKPVRLPASGQRAKDVSAELDIGQPVFWLTGERGVQVDWCVSFVPHGQDVDFGALLDDPKVVTFTGGLFFAGE